MAKEKDKDGNLLLHLIMFNNKVDAGGKRILLSTEEEWVGREDLFHALLAANHDGELLY